MKLKFLTSVLLVFLSSCQVSEPYFQMEPGVELVGIPSASGIVNYKSYFYIIGDDTPYLFKLNDKFHQITQLEYYETSIDFDSISLKIPKAGKPDFEAMEVLDDEQFLIIGSGSLSPERDKMILINPNPEVPEIEEYSLAGLYDQFRKNPGKDGKTLNIEGLAAMENILLLFDRGSNRIFKFRQDEFLKRVKNNSSTFDFESLEFELPKIQDVKAGFSGACFYPAERILLITASVEATPNAYDDGEILGSFLGVIALDDLASEANIEWHPIVVDGPALKIESVALGKKRGSRSTEILMVSDSDGGSSYIVKGIISW